MAHSAPVRAATIAALIGNSIFGFSFMFSRMALDVAVPFVMLMYRFIIAAVLLAAAAAVSARRGVRDDGAGGIHFMRFSLRGRSILPLIALGVVQPVLYFFCESYGISMTNATFSGVIIALIPIVALVFGALFLRERPRAAQVLWSLVSIAGVILMTMQQSAEGEIRLSGVLLLFGAVFTGVIYNIISRGISGEFSVLERTLVMMITAAVVFAAAAVIQVGADPVQLLSPLASPVFLGAIVYLSVFSSVGAFFMLNYANSYLPVAKTTAFCNLTTVISLFAGVVFLGEPFGPVSLAASVMIVLGIWGVQRN